MEDSLEAREAALRICVHDLRNQVMPMQLRLDVAHRLSEANDSAQALAPLLDAMAGSLRALTEVVERMEGLLGTQPTSPNAAMPGAGLQHGATGLRLLIVDDNPALTGALAELMQADGRFTEVHCTDSASGALSRVADIPYDLALVDVHLGDGDGLILCSQLVSLHAQRVVLMSGRLSGEFPAQAHAHGALGWIAKGADLHDLPNRLFALATDPSVPPQSRPR